VPFKSGARAEIENTGYAIIANVGDQRSDLGGHAECTFKVPNPYYVIVDSL
jgi:acid phosphatase